MSNFLVSTWEDSGQTAIHPTATDFAGSAIAPRVGVFVPLDFSHVNFLASLLEGSDVQTSAGFNGMFWG